MKTFFINSFIQNSNVDSSMVEEVLHNTLKSILEYLPKLAFALISFFVLWKVITLILKFVRKTLTKREIDLSVVNFVTLMISVLLRIVLILGLVNYLGFEVTSLVAMIGAAGLAIGLALQGTLQNFAGGVIILILKPFKTGDDVEFGGDRGIVKEVQLFCTVIEKHGTNENLIVPNSSISSSSLINWSSERNRRIDLPFGVAYGSDLKQVKQLIIENAIKDPRVVNPENTTILVTELADNSVNFELKVWVKPADFLTVRSDMMEMVYNTLNENNIDIPFPQLTIHKN